MNRLITLAITLSLASPLLSESTFDKQIDKFFDNFNISSNQTSSTSINSQMGVHFLGGNGTARMHVYDVNPIHVQFPNFSAGCGGIDYTLGGINIASKEEIKKSLKSIASNGAGYAFLLGIETLSPLVASVMKQVQTWANQLNAININSCEISSSLVQGMWPKTQAASSYICEHATTTDPLFSDLIEAKHGCRDDKSKKAAAIKKVQQNNQDIFVGNYNIAWKALSRMEGDEETKNLFMNITGTIVVHEATSAQKSEKSIQIYPPQYKKALELLRFGGSMEKAYKIESNEIDIKPADSIQIPSEKAWKTRTYKTLKSLQEKVVQEKTDKEVTTSAEEINLINTTHFPIGSLLSLMAQYNGKGSIITLERYSDLIAFERVLQFAEEVVRDTLSQAEALRAVQVSGYELDEYIKQVQQVLSDLQTLNLENYQKISVEHQVINYLIQMDRSLRDKERGL